MTGPEAGPLRVVVVQGGASVGGSETWLARVLEAATGLESHVVVLSAGPLVEQLVALGVEVETVPIGPSVRGFLPASWHVARLARRTHADVILANGVKPAALSIAAGLVARVPVVWVRHDHAYDGWIARTLARAVRTVAGTSTELVTALRRPDAPVLPVPRPSVAPASPASASEFWIRRGVSPEPHPVAAFVGRLVPSKGVECLIRALACPAAIDWRLVIIGPDDVAAPGEQVRLERLAALTGVEGRVVWAGAVADAGHWLAAFDAVAVPTGRGGPVAGEGFGLVVLEALLAGVPVVATEGIPALRLAGGAGAAVPARDPDALALALSLSANRTEAAGARGSQLLRDYPDARTVAAALVTVLRDASGGRLAASERR